MNAVLRLGFGSTGGFVRRSLVYVGALLACVALAFLTGPRATVHPTLRPLVLPPDLDRYLAEAEARFPDLRPGTEKQIVWADAGHTPTPLAIVYLHGFTASRREVEPLCTRLAERLHANLFFTRLAGHGLPGAALGEVSANDWFNDASEALAIGTRLGRKVVVIGTSTGGTLAVWLALQPEADRLQAIVLMSPNFGLKDPRSALLTWPWGRQLVELVAGSEHVVQPLSEEHGRVWTTRYPTRVLPRMAALVAYVRDAPVESIRTPVLVIRSRADEVVEPKRTDRVFSRLGSSQKRLFEVKGFSFDNHMAAGDIMAPTGTIPVEAAILEFLAQLPEPTAAPKQK